MARDEDACPLKREFYLRGAGEVAPELLGKLLVHRTAAGVTAGIIAETEAYIGPDDKGAHSYLNKRTDRTEIQFGQGGYAYIYAIYGMYSCFNVVTNDAGKPEVVLVRALEPVEGVPLMGERRGVGDIAALCSGPGKLCDAMGISKAQYGWDLCGAELYIAPFQPVAREQILVSPRININYADEYRDLPWRYFLRDNPFVSKVARRYRERERVLDT